MHRHARDNLIFIIITCSINSRVALTRIAFHRREMRNGIRECQRVVGVARRAGEENSFG